MKTLPSSKLTYFLYARRSSESEDKQIQSIGDQLARLKELAQAHNLEVKEIFTESKSAKKPYIRPVFADMLRRIEKGEANGILAWHLNRLSRNPVDSGALDWMLQQGVLQAIQTMEKRYLPEDNVLLFNIEASMANQYIIELRKACMRGMDRRAELGWKPGMAPLGYVNSTANKIDKTIIPDPERFAQVRQMWDLMLTGNYTPQAIRQIANYEWGFRTIQHKSKGGTELPLWGIYNLFSNIFYTGMFEWKGKLFPGNHTPMITLAEYDKVQTLLRKKDNPRPQHHSFSYTGLIRCATCYMMFSASKKRKQVISKRLSKTYVYYHCSRKSKQINCNNSPVALPELELEIERELERFTISPEFLEWALNCINSIKDQANKDSENTRKMQEATLRQAQKELTNLTRMRYQELIDDEDFITERTNLKNQIAKLQEQLNIHIDYTPKWNELTRSAFIFAAYAKREFRNGSVEVKRSIVSSLGSNYRIKDKKLIFDNAFWLIPIQKAYEPLYAEFKRLELEKHLHSEAWNAFLQPLILVWCTLVEEVRTAIMQNGDTSLHIYEPKLGSTLEIQKK